jgi:hypothetical protein
MPKDTRSSPPQSPASTSTFKELAQRAQAVNRLSDSLRTTIESVDDALRKLNLGITTWVSVHTEHTSSGDIANAFDGYQSLELGYAKVAGTWGIAVRHLSAPADDPANVTVVEWPFNDAPRVLRLDAIDGLAQLFQQLTIDVDALGSRLFDKVTLATGFATSILASAEELGRAEKNSGNRKDNER